MQSTREIDEIFIPLKKSHSGNIQQNVVDVVVLVVSSSRSDPTPQVAAPPRYAHVRCSDVSSFPLSSKYDGEIDWICSTTTWCLWWRVSVAGLRLRAVGRERGGGAAVGQRLGLEWVEVAPLPSLYRGLAVPLYPSSKP